MSRRARVSAIVTVGVFVSSLDLFIVNIAFPAMARDFDDTSIADLSWVLNAYAIVYAALLVPAGRWADLVGRKRVFLSGLALFTAASAACGAAPSVEALVAFRIVQAAGAALLMPASLGLLLAEYPPEKRGLAVGLWAATAGAAAAFGPVVGGLLVELSWHWVFLVNLPVGVVAIALGLRVLTEARDPRGSRPDVPGAVVLAAAVAALVAAIIQGPDWGWDDPRVLALFAAFAVLGAVVVVRSRTHPTPVLEPALLRVRAFRAATVAGISFFVAFAAMLLGVILFLTEVRGESVVTAGLMLAPGPVTAALCSVPGGLLSGRIGPRAVGTTGALSFAAAGVWWLAWLSADGSYALEVLPGLIVSGGAVGLVNPALAGASTASLPPERLATGSAVLGTARQIGFALGVAVLVAILGTPTGAASFDEAWVLLVAGAAGAAVAFAAAGPARAVAPASREDEVPLKAAA